jgi:ATP-dependent Lon protease
MEIPNAVPVMTLPSATLFPQALLPLYIFEPRYRRMLADTLRTHRLFSVAMQKPGRVRETPCAVAGLGFIRVSVDHPDGTAHLILQGLTRVELREPLQTRPYRVHSIRVLESPATDSVVVDALTAKVHELVRQRLALGPLPFPFPVVKNLGAKAKVKPGGVTSGEILRYLEHLPNADQLADLVTCALLADAPLERQKILETVDVTARLKHLVHFLLEEIRRRGKNSKP